MWTLRIRWGQSEGVWKLCRWDLRILYLRTCFCAVFPTLEQACAGFVYQACNRWWDANCGLLETVGLLWSISVFFYSCFCSQLLQSTKILQWIQIPMWSQDLIFPGVPNSPCLKMTGGPIVLPNNKYSPSPVSPVTQGSDRTFGLLCQQCLLTSQSSKVTSFSKWFKVAAEVWFVHLGTKTGPLRTIWQVHVLEEGVVHGTGSTLSFVGSMYYGMASVLSPFLLSDSFSSCVHLHSSVNPALIVPLKYWGYISQ